MKGRLRRCFEVLQTHDVSLDPDLRPAEEIADGYLAHLFQDCAAHSGRIFVEIWRSRVIGYVAVMAQVVPDPLDSHPNPYASLHDLVVLEEARGIGAGRALS